MLTHQQSSGDWSRNAIVKLWSGRKYSLSLFLIKRLMSLAFGALQIFSLSLSLCLSTFQSLRSYICVKRGKNKRELFLWKMSEYYIGNSGLAVYRYIFFFKFSNLKYFQWEEREKQREKYLFWNERLSLCIAFSLHFSLSLLLSKLPKSGKIERWFARQNADQSWWDRKKRANLI